MHKKILITGAAGFIGFHLSKRMMQEGYHVIGVDNLNDYYDVNLKTSRLDLLLEDKNFKFEKVDLVEREKIHDLFKSNNFEYVVNLAAQAGVRYSLVNPYAYIDSNISGFLNILEACRQNPVKHLVYASSSSVYGANTKMPFSVHHNVDHPVSLYAATKKANELMAHTYANLYKVPSTGLRFFTVYGPWGRPDMALFLFTKAIIEGKPIDVYNHGKMKRDFTYVDDIVEGIARLIPNSPKPNPDWNGDQPDPASSFAPYKIYNIGNNQPVELMKFIDTIEHHIGKEAIKNYMDIQMGDVPATYADVDDLMNDVGFKPNTSINAGIGNFIKWYKEFYKNK
jgi:UDP-glucuronate 4-epimerase